MKLFDRLFIDGAWRTGSQGETFPVLNPADGSELARFAVATQEDCIAAIDAAERALSPWAATPARERSEILRSAFEILREDREKLAEIISLENGKAHADALGEANYAIEFFRWFAEEAVRIPGEFRLSPSGDKRILVTRQPIGVSLLITPWNFPAAMATRKLAPALAAGCTTILKPARETPLTAAFVVDALSRAGVPAGVVNLVTPVPTGPLVSEMLHHPSVRKLSFTGSTEVGRILLREAADLLAAREVDAIDHREAESVEGSHDGQQHRVGVGRQDAQRDVRGEQQHRQPAAVADDVDRHLTLHADADRGVGSQADGEGEDEQEELGAAAAPVDEAHQRGGSGVVVA